MNGYPPRRPNKMPLIILAVAAIAVVIYFVTKKKEDAYTLPPEELAAAEAAGDPPPDPCKGVPEWACAATKLLNPLAQTTVDVYKIKKGVY